jgi:hypothetical protein
MLEAFAALSVALEERGLKGTVFVVGGAAMALAYNARRTTRDCEDPPRSSVTLLSCGSVISSVTHRETGFVPF